MSEFGRDRALREPWEDLVRQRHAALAGIWFFSASELLFFGGLFVAYAANFFLWPDGFHAAGAETGLRYGLSNTVILLCSSACVAVAAASARWPSLGRISRAFVWATIALGLCFLVVKGLEYADDLRKGLLPGPRFTIGFRGAQLFFAFYWTATAVHAIHLSVGIVLLARLAWAGRRDPAWYAATPQVNVTALYWGFIDVIWTILFVLIYLPGRAS